MGEQGDHSALVNTCTLLVDKLICRIDHINEDVSCYPRDIDVELICHLLSGLSSNFKTF